MSALGTILLSVETTLTLSIGEGTEALDGDTLKVYRVEGQEAISEPFRYAVDLLCVSADNEHLVLTSDKVLGKTATLQITVADGGSEMVRKVHGVVEEFMVDERFSAANGATDTVSHYRVVLAPRLAMLARNRQNRIHATSVSQTLEEIIRDKLLSSGADYSTQEQSSRVVLEADEFRIDIDNGNVPLDTLSHVAQYDETDVDFIRRLCECHGVYFFFAANADDTRGMVVFGNTNSPFGVVRFEADTNSAGQGDGTGGEDSDMDSENGSSSPTSYQASHRLDIELTIAGATGLVGGSTYMESTDDEPAELDGALYSFTSVHRPTPGHLHVIDDQAPGSDMDLRRTVTLDAGGRGVHAEYGTHFSTQDAGDAFAAIRAEEIKAANHYYLGLTNSPCVAPGRTFTKASGNDADRPVKEFLVTRVVIEVKQAHADVITEIDGEVIETGFSNRFRCIDFDSSADCAFRPPRVTPIPRLPGVHTAYIATGKDERPLLDDEGAYRIYQKFADERADLDVGVRSMAVRKAEPYAGDGVGMHFPLKKDTEVLVAYRNGDPDRPVIAAAMPGVSDHQSPVTGANQTSHVIETTSGARFEIHDNYDDARSRVTLRSRESSEHASYLRLGKAHIADSAAEGSTSGEGSAAPGAAPATLEDHYAENVHSADKEKRDGIALYTADNIREATKKDKITEAQGTIRVHAGEDIYSRSVEKHLLRGKRMVIYSGAAEHEPTDETNTRDESDRSTMNDDDMFLLSRNDIYIKARGDIHETALGSVTEETGGDLIKRIYRDSYTYIYANSHRYVEGSSNSMVMGANTSFSLGFRAIGAVAGSVALVGPAWARLYYGVGAFMWPQVMLFHGVVLANTIEKLLISHTGATKKTTALSIKQNAIRLGQAVTRVSLGQLVARITSSYTVM